jgi:hypothetical protein
LRRVVIAGASDWGAYANTFCSDENSRGLGVLASLLAAVWDFDSDIANPKIDPSKMLGAPIRAYYQGNPLPAGAPAGSLLIDARSGRWRNYVERQDSGDPVEIPPLPPDPTNSNADTSKDGHDSPHRSPPTPPAAGGGYTHHLIRDFMFLDAAAANDQASGPPPSPTLSIGQQLTVNFLSLNPADFAGEDSALGNFTRGTGSQQVSNKYLLDTATASVTGSGDLAFLHDGDVGLSFKTLLYQLIDLRTNAPADSSNFSPNWFGVAVPNGITDFTNVVIYFHPTPQQAGYMDPDYASKTNGCPDCSPTPIPPNPRHTYWKELLGYVDRLGSQLAGAVKHSNATPNQIVIVPLMMNVNVDGGVAAAAGILPRQWYYIVNDILTDLPTRLGSL